MDLIEEVVPLDGRQLVIARPRAAEALLDEARFSAEDEFIPYWADLWPSAILLARTLAGRSLRGARVLELGCGLGLPALAAALAGGRVVAADWAPEAIEALRDNARRNDVEVEGLVADWRDPRPFLARGPFDLVIAADVVYERRNAEPLRALLNALAAETWLADPHRAPADQLVADLELDGWNRSALAESDSPRIVVHRLSC